MKTNFEMKWEYQLPLIDQMKEQVKGWLESKGCTDIAIEDMAGTEADLKGNCDLRVTFLFDGKKETRDIACRNRSSNYWQSYADEITIRSVPLYGGQTEFNKLMGGYGHLMFSAFESGGDIFAVKVIHLEKLRTHLKEETELKQYEHANWDGTEFYAIPVINSAYADSLLDAWVTDATYLMAIDKVIAKQFRN